MAGITWKNFLDAMNPKKSFIAKTIDDKRRKDIEEENVSDGTDWYNEPGALTDNSKIDEQVEKELANTKDEFTGQKKEPLEGQRGSAKGNQGDNDLAYNNYEEKFFPTGVKQLIPMIAGDQGETKSTAQKPENTAEVEKRHTEEQAALQNALGTSEPVSGTIIHTPSLGEEVGGEEVEGSGETPSGNTKNKKTDWKSIYDEYMGPKNGADYVKSLWNNGEYGKAVGNVLGNLLGSLGTINVGGASTGGRDFHSDWEDYRTNYTQAQKERNQTAFNNGMDLLKRAEMNQQDLEKQAGMNELDLSKREAMNTQDLDFLQKEVDKKLKMSKDLKAEDIALLQSFNNALNAGGISTALSSLGSKGIAKLAEILGL